jgi:hypothetical protein
MMMLEAKTDQGERFKVSRLIPGSGMEQVGCASLRLEIVESQFLYVQIKKLW